MESIVYLFKVLLTLCMFIPFFGFEGRLSSYTIISFPMNRSENCTFQPSTFS